MPESTNPTTASSDKQSPNSGNGGTGPNYTWTQTLKDVTVSMDVAEGTRGRDLAVEIKKQQIKVVMKKTNESILEGPLFKEIVVDDSFWSIEDQKHLVITLQKSNGMEWWAKVIEGHPEIDTQKVEPEAAKLSDLDSDTRATVEKMMYDQRQKQLGLPTSEEQQQQRMVEQLMKSNPNMAADFEKMSGQKFNPVFK